MHPWANQARINNSRDLCVAPPIILFTPTCPPGRIKNCAAVFCTWGATQKGDSCIVGDVGDKGPTIETHCDHTLDPGSILTDRAKWFEHIFDQKWNDADFKIWMTVGTKNTYHFLKTCQRLKEFRMSCQRFQQVCQVSTNFNKLLNV